MPSTIYQKRIANDIKEIIVKSEEIEEIKHKGLRGSFRESAIGKIFKKYLSPSWDIGEGEIIDSVGNISNETDLIIFNRYNVPPILLTESSGAYPIESCAYAFEIKSTSNSTEMESTVKKFRNLKILKSASNVPITIYFAFNTDLITKTEFERYTEKDTEFNINPCIDAICVIGKGYWYHSKVFDQGNLRSLTWHFQEAVNNHEISMLLVGVINTLSNFAMDNKPWNFGNYFIENCQSKISYHNDIPKKLEIKVSDSDKYNQFLTEVSENNYDSSIGCIHKVLDDKSQIASILYDIGMSKKKEMQYDASIFYLNSALEYNESLKYNIRIFHVRGLAKFELSRYKEAIEDFESAIKLNPLNADLYFCMGHSFIRLWNTSEDAPLLNSITRCFNKCIELNPRDEQALLHRAMAFTNLRCYTEAKVDYQRIIGINPNNRDALMGLAMVEHNMTLKKERKFSKFSFLEGNFE